VTRGEVGGCDVPFVLLGLLLCFLFLGCASLFSR
jgi:hypothetical protein